MGELEYRLNFVLRAMIEIAYLVTNLVFYNVIYGKTESIAGWSYKEMLFLLITTSFIDSIVTFLFNNSLSDIPVLIQQGNMDFVLLKPVNKRIFISFRKFVSPQLVNMFVYIAFYIYLFVKYNINLSIVEFIIYVVLLLNSVFILYNLFFIVMTCSFWTVKMDNAVNMYYQLYQVGNKPKEIFPYAIQFLFLMVFPVFVAFNFPVQFIFDHFTFINAINAIAVSILLYLFSKFIFKKAISHYSSTGN